ncbi:hypothetical protein NQT66_17635 [Cellulophaga baltica]|uniref:hypothetical protein n=1 Tax=Cellulophaga baltica TaxID=76594 RepID=UPI0021497A0E|nr:hypothetical protein [Cellulophaga baltica]MCR1026645.1 hypothetical protein [Cellulophaga baltica]
MKKRYKYDVGIVIENGQEVEIRRYDLEDEGIRTKYKGKLILDKSREFKLYIRNRGKSSHFYSRGKSRKGIHSKKYRTEKHIDRINTIYNFINARDRVRICYYYWEYGSKKPKPETIFTFNNYIFAKEVKQSLTNENYFIADIFGISETLNNSDREPNIAIEVIDSHFPSFKTFNYYRKITKEQSLIVIFYYIEFEMKLNHMMNNKGENNNGKLRISHYMQDGSFWIGEDRIEEKNYDFIKTYQEKIDFSDDESYYRAINELELNRIRNSR